MIATTDKEIENDALPRNQQFILLSVYHIERTKIIKLKYPWGKVQWQGNFSSVSDSWTPQLRRNIGVLDEN